MEHVKVIHIVEVEESPPGSEIPMFLSPISAGFPSPADDVIDIKVNLDQELITNRAATFLVRVSGNSMIKAGINDGAVLVVDRSLTPKSGDIVVAVVDNEFLVKSLLIKGVAVYLLPSNENYEPILLNEAQGDMIWGVVSSCINKFR